MASFSPMARREILLYGTSSNPLTGMEGHMGAISHCRSLGFDEIWILPVYQHIYSTKRSLAPFEHRVNLSRLAIEALPPPSKNKAAEKKCHVGVFEYERELFKHLAQATDIKPEELRIGSIDLIRYLTDRFPDASFTMLLGADTFADLQAGKWKNGEELKRLVKLVVMSRKGYDTPDGSQVTSTEQDRIRFVTIPSLTDISSTYVRSVEDATELKTLVAPQVAEYIIQNKLYAFGSEK